MLPIRTTDLFDPPSSPASSAAGTWSSPPSSPVIEPLSLESENEEERTPLVTRVTDPYAASYGLRSVNRGKRPGAVLTLDESPSKRSRKANPYPHIFDDSDNEAGCSKSPIKSPLDHDAQLWDRAIEEAFSDGKRKIELSGANISRIPSRTISDLAKLTVLPSLRLTLYDAGTLPLALRSRIESRQREFMRAQTVPAFSTVGWGSRAAQNKSVSASNLESDSSPDIEIFLANNNISSLPTELWTLKNLTILSLRMNKIVYLPPEIAKLERLVELNVAYNKLTFLPSEVITMYNLRNLVVTGNPFLPKPISQKVPPFISKTTLNASPIPALTEIALRILIQPTFRTSELRPQAHTTTLLEDLYIFPLPVGPPYRAISDPIRQILSACVPGSVPISDQSSVPNHILSNHLPGSTLIFPITGISQCPNPLHCDNRSVFVHHVEERFTWVNRIMKIDIGVYAPLRWRGCERGCLDFLDPPPETPEEREQSESEDNVPTAGEEEPVIQTLDFQAAGLDFDDE